VYMCVCVCVCVYCILCSFGPRAHRLYFYRIIFQQTMAYFFYLFFVFIRMHMLCKGGGMIGRADRIQIIR
jgi:hypothetical protein